MASTCPICDAEMGGGVPYCPSCGFPAALAVDALHAAREPETNNADTDQMPPPKPVPRAAGSTADPQAEIIQRVAGELESQLDLVRRLGADLADVSAEMRQAALTQVDGRTGEAVGLLRGALGRATARSKEMIEQRIRELENRQSTLRREGVGVSLGVQVIRVQSELEAGRREPAIDLLLAADQELTRIETQWKGLRGLLRQIDELRASAQLAGERLAEVEEAIGQIRGMLAQPTMSDETLDEAAQLAARALLVLHEALPSLLERELDRHAQQLDAFPDDHAPARPARALHAEAVRHLRRGKLPETTARLRELRQVIAQLGEPPVTSPEPPVGEGAIVAASPAGVGENQEEALSRLLQKARGLAARVRGLPSESELAYEAAVEIRRATELLRARKLPEAEGTLAKLMRTLDAEVVLER